MKNKITYEIITGICLIVVAVLFCALPVFSQYPADAGIQNDDIIYYTIEKGDTLWDLSQRFLNNPSYWPYLWEENNDIPIYNPHLIYPGQRIRILKKRPGGPVPGVNFGAIPAQPASGLAIPSPVTADGTPKFDSAFDDRFKGTSYYYSPIRKVGFIRRTPVKPDGYIFKVKDNKQMISKDDMVYIQESAKNRLVIGKRYTLYRTFNPIRDERTDQIIGTQHYLTGLVEITEKFPQYCIGVIKDSYRTIYVNDMLMPYEPRSQKVSLTPPAEKLKGRIISAEEQSATLIGEHSIVFVNKGEKHGVKPGQEYSIFYQETATVGSTPKNLLLKPVDYGRLLVLHTESTTATALIIRSSKAIHPGDNIHSPR